MQKVFSKEKWLVAANEQKEKKILSQREIDDACEIWVNDLDGTTFEDLKASGNDITLHDEYFDFK